MSAKAIKKIKCVANSNGLKRQSRVFHNVYKAYDRILPDYNEREKKLFDALDRLLVLGKEAESPLLRELKPIIALSLKWRFDYLAKCLASPFELEPDVNYWQGVLKMMLDLGKLGWHAVDGNKAKPLDVWKRTAQGFDKGWTATTEGEQFAVSRQIAQDRTDQILAMLGGPHWVEGKQILDCGCGPGRYIDILRKLSPKRIVGLDQGARLFEVLKERFKDDPKVEIMRGTCEKLELEDRSFDFVLSNGVLHHTPSDIHTMLKDHVRVLKPGGAMFIMLVGKGGLELKMWEFVRNFLYDIPIETMLNTFGNAVSPLRMQGIVDHMYGEYQQTDRAEFEQWCHGLFKEIKRVPGIAGLDVTPELYNDDPYYIPRFGTGHLRYLCFK